ncbi:uncharacterized protein [Typha latifolia]|uniref:uncharacterized protein n=1 Tax=Typha latifolia TaxID=4733 RepID=UPI003C2E0CCC
MTVKGGTSQACAACKYQRRRCTAECPLAPYFPPDMPRQFQNAHRLFGVSKILKIIDKLDPPYKTEAMRSIVYESNLRERYPVRGCVELINALLFQIRHMKFELDAVNSQLATYRHYLESSDFEPNSSSSSPPIAAAATTNYLPLLDPDYMSISVADTTKSDIEDNGTDANQSFWTHDQLDVNENADNNSVISVATPGFHAPLGVQAGAIEHDYYDEMPSYFDIIDDDHAFESSSDSSQKDTVTIENYGMDNELKNAAACFSLTSVIN